MISHGKKVARLPRPADQRKALLRNLTTDLLRYGRTTTMARAKAMRKPVEHMIQLGKDGGDHKKRQAEAYIFDKDLVTALFEAAPSATRPLGWVHQDRQDPSQARRQRRDGHHRARLDARRAAERRGEYI